MKSRRTRAVPPAAVAWAVLATLTACGTDATDTTAGRGVSHEVPVPGPPRESRPPVPGKGSQDPDDVNGDGYPDLVLPVPGTGQFAVLHGSQKGLDPSVRKVYSRGDMGLPRPPEGSEPDGDFAPDTVADLDGDGFPDFVTVVEDKRVGNEAEDEYRAVPYVSWGGSRGPAAGARATPVRLPEGVSPLGLSDVVRGDFDGDGHHDLAARTGNGPGAEDSSLAVLYGPFTRSGVPARTDTDVTVPEGDLAADDIDPSGEPRPTSVLVHEANDGEQSRAVLHGARRGSGLTPVSKRLRAGNAHAFGDFDGDGERDVAVGDDGSRNDEPGYETEPPEVGGSLTVYSGRSGTPARHRLPEVPEGAATDYGPGGFLAADPDGDGRDGILVATYDGATLIDGGDRVAVGREVRKGPRRDRNARPAGAADFDVDGKDELILNWAHGGLFGLYGEGPTHWWITDGTTPRDEASFAAAGLAREPDTP